MKERHPGRFILKSCWDPRDEEAGLRKLEEEAARWNLKGAKLYTAEWKGSSKGWKLTDPWARRYLDKCAELGIKNIHVHKGPPIWPPNQHAVHASPVDDVASADR